MATLKQANVYSCEKCGKTGYKSENAVKLHQRRSKVCKGASVMKRDEIDVASALLSIGGKLVTRQDPEQKQLGNPGAAKKALKELRGMRERVYKFVTDHFDDYDFDRACERDQNEDNNFDDFLARNKEVIDAKDSGELEKICILVDLIEGGMYNMDKEHMTPFETSGFYFNSEAKLVLFNER